MPHRCMLMSWIPGVPLGKRLTPANLEYMGMLHARMHAYSATFEPPEGFTTRKLSSYLARDEPEVLFSESCADAFAGESLQILTEVREYVQAGLEELYADPTGLRVIHHDLWHDNIKLDRHHKNDCGGLRPLDFEDTVWGYPVQDLAAAIQDLRDELPPESIKPAVAAFQRGYERLAEWPESIPGEIEWLRAGRALWVANYVARFQRPYLESHLKWLTPLMERFLAGMGE
jgi:Ser/Thr protein kinase RdoA (MazF antagonist)